MRGSRGARSSVPVGAGCGAARRGEAVRGCGAAGPCWRGRSLRPSGGTRGPLECRGGTGAHAAGVPSSIASGGRCVCVTEEANPPSDALPAVRDGVSRNKTQFFPPLRVVF